MADKPTLWIIAGANGSGKSSAYREMTVDADKGSIWIINPDELSKRIAEQEGLPLDPEANLESVKRIERWLYASIEAHQTVGVETVLSSPKYRALVESAHRQGFFVRLIYVVLDDADLNVERVRIRVAQGGHAVEEEKIRERRVRSFEQFAWFFEHVDRVDVYDNSGAEPSLLVTKHAHEVTIYGRPIDEVIGAMAVSIPDLAGLFESE